MVEERIRKVECPTKDLIKQKVGAKDEETIAEIKSGRFVTQRKPHTIFKNLGGTVGVSKKVVDTFIRGNPEVRMIELKYIRDDGLIERRQEPKSVWLEKLQDPDMSFGNFEPQYHRTRREWGMGDEGKVLVLTEDAKLIGRGDPSEVVS